LTEDAPRDPIRLALNLADAALADRLGARGLDGDFFVGAISNELFAQIYK